MFILRLKTLTIDIVSIWTQHTYTAAARAQTRFNSNLSKPTFSYLEMYKLRKGELIAAIEEFGETPPPKWTVPELRTRLLQLQEEHGVSTVKKKTDMRQWVVRLNSASKKKAELQQFCRQE